MESDVTSSDSGTVHLTKRESERDPSTTGGEIVLVFVPRSTPLIVMEDGCLHISDREAKVSKHGKAETLIVRVMDSIIGRPMTHR
jgi:hypothetical protein